MKKPTLKKLYFSPVKSLSFSSRKNLKIKKNIGIINDRIFAFTRLISEAEANDYKNNPNKRNLNFFLTLRNSPFLNKYNFEYKENELRLLLKKNLIKKIDLNNNNNLKLISDELIKRESIVNYFPYLIKNINFPFFDTMPQNSISLININSIKDLEKKTKKTIEFERFRGNLYIDGIKPWQERNWIKKIIKINDVSYKVEKNIARCSAINLEPNTDNATINLPMILKKYYNHIDMGVYLTPLDDGEINIGDQVILDE